MQLFYIFHSTQKSIQNIFKHKIESVINIKIHFHGIWFVDMRLYNR